MRTTTAILSLVVLLTGCQGGEDTPVSATPVARAVIVLAPGVASDQTAAQVAQKTLAAIAENERTIGRALAPARIIKVELVGAGDTVMLDNLDGSQSGQGVGPSGGPSWVVEAVGTFIYRDWRHGHRISELAVHGLFAWDDAGTTSQAFSPCWTLQRQGAPLDGVCGAP